MARKKGIPVSTVLDVEFPVSANRGRAPVPSEYASVVEASYNESTAKAIVFDGTEDEYTRIKRDVVRGARQLDKGLRGPLRSEVEGSPAVVFQAVDKRSYNGTGERGQCPNCGKDVVRKADGELRKHNCATE